jgi:hypothetical protein
MFTTGIYSCPGPQPGMKGTLWHCEKCGSFIFLHTERMVEDLSCPVCLNELEFCNSFDSGLVQPACDA